MVYLDNNATTPLAPGVLDAMLPYLTGQFGNPSSPHAAGMAAKTAVGSARAVVASLIGGRPAEVIFTASASEANHTAILGILADAPSGRRGFVTTAVEHPSILLLARDLVRRGWPVTIVPVDDQGRVDLAELAAAVDGTTALVSVQWANNETGTIQPVTEAAAIAHAAGALFHTDAVQAAGRIPVSGPAAGADLLTISAHKIHGPKGIGALWVRKGTDLAPLVHGHQERSRRGGTENVPAIAGFAAAALQAMDALPAMADVAALRDRLERAILAGCPGAAVNGAGADRLPNTANIRFSGPQGYPLNGEELLMRLDRAGIQVSMGAACASGGNAPSHVLLALGLSGEEASSCLRFSLSRFTSADDIAAVENALPPLFARFARVTGFSNDKKTGAHRQ